MRRMKTLMIVLVAVIAIAVILVCIDVLGHDQTFSEASKGLPDQLWQAFGSLVALAWQYKLATGIVLGIGIAILLVRQVPDRI